MITLSIPTHEDGRLITLLEGDVLALEGTGICLRAEAYAWPRKPLRPMSEILARLNSNREALAALESKLGTPVATNAAAA